MIARLTRPFLSALALTATTATTLVLAQGCSDGENAAEPAAPFHERDRNTPPKERSDTASGAESTEEEDDTVPPVADNGDAAPPLSPPTPARGHDGGGAPLSPVAGPFGLPPLNSALNARRSESTAEGTYPAMDGQTWNDVKAEQATTIGAPGDANKILASASTHEFFANATAQSDVSSQLDAMLAGLWNWFATSEDARAELIKTDPAVLIFSSDNGLWGTGKDQAGMNHVGQMMMSIRTRFKSADPARGSVARYVWSGPALLVLKPRN